MYQIDVLYVSDRCLICIVQRLRFYTPFHFSFTVPSTAKNISCILKNLGVLEKFLSLKNAGFQTDLQINQIEYLYHSQKFQEFSIEE